MNSRDWPDGWERVLALSKTDSQGRAIEITDEEEKELKQLGRNFWGKETRGESSPKIKEQVQEMRLKLVKENIDAINKFLRKHKLAFSTIVAIVIWSKMKDDDYEYYEWSVFLALLILPIILGLFILYDGITSVMAPEYDAVMSLLRMVK